MGPAVLEGSWSSGPGPQQRLRIRTDDRGFAVVVHVEGEIDYTTAGLLRETVRTAAEPISPPRVVLDFDQVTFCDSSGLGTLVAIWKGTRASGGDLLVARPPGIFRRMLQRTGLERHITITPTLDAALILLSPRPLGAPGDHIVFTRASMASRKDGS
ncbi:STAS domain-containing protein [Spirillospora sp. CA-255316]